MTRVLPLAFIGAFPAAISGAVPEPVPAQDRALPGDLVESLARCLDIADDAGRLACTDTAGRALVDATRRRQVVMVDQSEVKATRRSLFGFALPRIGLFGRNGADKEQEVAEVDGSIAAIFAQAHGRYVITMTDGARWSTTESWIGVPPPVGGTVTIRRGSLGGYFVQARGGRAIRALRTG